VTGIFFVHIMKTGGTSLSDFLRRQFGDAAIYPPFSDPIGSETKQQPTHLLELPVEERRRFRAYSVHMPAWVADAVAPHFHKVTVLREPVARTVSHLRQISQMEGTPDTLEEIWDDSEWRLRLADYQTRFFAAERPSEDLSEEMKEALRQHLASGSNRRQMSDQLRPFRATAVPTIEVQGPADLRRAVQRLRGFDVVGLTEDLDAAGAWLAGVIGAPVPALARRNTAKDSRPVGRSLLRRLEDDLSLDVELYETAWELAGARAG
jgi:hypothetical protein